MRVVFLKILGFVIAIDLFYMGIGQWYLTQSEEHPPQDLEITLETDMDTLIGMGETMLKTKGGCLLCHKITEQGNTRAPDLRGVGGRAATRRPGMSAEAYLTESLRDPGAYVVAEFATAGGASIMPVADQPPADLSATELKALVAYLQSLGGEITVVITAEDVEAAEAKQRKSTASAGSTHPGFALLASQGCVACHDVAGTTRRVGPPLTDVRQRLSAAQIRQSIVDPNAVIAEGYQKDLMLKDFAEKLSGEELDQLVNYLSGEVSLTERLAHPAVHLFVLIVLFNGGITLAMRVMSSRGAAATADEPASESSSLRFWVVLFVVLGAIGLAVVFYSRGQGDSPELPAEAIAPEPGPEPAPDVALTPGSALDGEALYAMTCPACHGPDAKGIPGLGKDMTTSEFIQSRSDEELVAFIKQGRAVDDPLNTTGVPMPPKGANAALNDAEILAIVEFIRALQN